MTKKKAVKVRKWVTCAEPGCKRRAGTSRPYCGEHQKKFEEWTKRNEARKKKRDRHKAKGKPVIDCFEPGCSRAAGPAGYCKVHQKKWDKKYLQAQKSDAKKSKKKAPPMARIKDPGSRLLKAHCEKCNYTIRLSRKWIEVKRPICPVCMRNMATELDGLIDADPRQLKLKGGV